MEPQEYTTRYRKIATELMQLLKEWLPYAQEHEEAKLPSELLTALLPGLFRPFGSSSFLQVLVAPDDRMRGLRKIRDFTKDADKLMICDPYLFSGEKSDAKAIAEEFSRCARLNRKPAVHVIHDAAHTTKAVRQAVKKIASDAGATLTILETDMIHDRVWIADRQRAVVVGTSFNGIGKRAAFILPLPKEDLDAILDFLDENKLSRGH